MPHLTIGRHQKIRFIEIREFSEVGFLKAYQNRMNSPIYELPSIEESFLWDALVRLNNKSCEDIGGKEYDATLISIPLRQLKDNNDSAVDFTIVKHLLSFLYNINMINVTEDKKMPDITRKVFVCFRQECNEIERDYYKLSEILRIWVVQNNMYDDVRFYDETNNPKPKIPIRRLRASYTEKRKSYTKYVSGSLFPIVSLDRRSYEVLDNEYKPPNQSHKEQMASILSSLRETMELSTVTTKKSITDNYLESYLYAYIEKIFIDSQNDFEKYEKKLEDYYKLISATRVEIANYSKQWGAIWADFIKEYHPSVLIALFVSTIVSYIVSDKLNDIKNTIKDIRSKAQEYNKTENNHSVIDILSKNNWVALIEHCYSYAQGILQLIDNANIHVVEKRNESGMAIGNGAFLGFRVRDKNNVLRETTNKTLSQCNYFLEMFIVDCDFSNQVGIVDNYNSSLEEMNERGEPVAVKIKSLNEVFNYPHVDSQALKAYYSHTSNIAFHYGLQIFSGVVSSGNGFLTVVSGGEKRGLSGLSDITYCNDYNNYNIKDLCGYYVGNMRTPDTSAGSFQSVIRRYNGDDNIVHFSGTSYTILLPVAMHKLENSGYNFFLGNVHIGEKNNHNLKLCRIAIASNPNWEAGNAISTAYNGEQILNIDLTNTQDRKHIELVCKSILVKFVERAEIKALCFTGFKNEYALLDAVRIISLFYNKLGEFTQIKHKGIFLYCRYRPLKADKDREYELYFNGTSLHSIFDNIRRQQLVRDVPKLFIHELEAFLHRDGSNNGAVASDHDGEDSDSVDRPLSAAIIKYYLKTNDNDETIVQKQIKDILNNDIHQSPLGCKIEDTHVRIGRVHLDTFYEAQFLFGNAYCTDIFALYVADCVNKQKKQFKLTCGQEYDRIILYGYESYSTLTLHKALHFLDNGNENVEMLVYETVNERVRYLQKDLFSGKALVVYVMGISSTLSTFQQMNDAFTKACDKLNIRQNDSDKMCLSIIQIDGDGSENFITKIKEHGVVAYTTAGGRDYIKFALDNRAYCFVSAQSNWFAAEEGFCMHCLPEYNREKQNATILDERPLIEVDDTSVVPTQMIFPKVGDSSKDSDYDSGRENARRFLSINENSRYLRYGHIERYDNHFQYFFRIAALYHDKHALNEHAQEMGIERWLRYVRSSHSDAFDTSAKTVNILIAPQHFSNTGYVNSVSRCVFGDTAHIIELDIRKEYRSNFRTKYSNYRELAKFVKKNRDENGDGYKLNFYYVNDQIITGRTFKRAESLINTLLGKNGNAQNGKTFRGVFTLVDRNSYETRKAYIEPIVNGEREYLPFFSYLRFDVPSLRNHDNSCPLCAQNEAAKKIVGSSAFTSTVHYWQEKIVYHKQRTSDDVRKIDEQMALDINTYSNTKMRNFRRLQCENELWRALNHSRDRDSAYNSIIQTFLSRDPQGGFHDENSLFEFIKDLESKDAALSFALFKLTITRLCAIGSCVLLNHNRLIDCLEIGNNLEQKANGNSHLKDEFRDYGEYIISYIKVMSRPLLYYREPVKWAVLKLLLKILSVYLDAEHTRTDPTLLAEGQDTGHYAQRFDGFLLNALKRLLCYDKGVSKCNYCDKLVFEKDAHDNPIFVGKYAEFFKRLYIENNRFALNECEHKLILDSGRKAELEARIQRNKTQIAELHKSNTEEIEAIKRDTLECEEELKERIFNQVKIDYFERIIDKYDYIVSRLKYICLEKNSEEDIAFFIVRQNEENGDVKKEGITWIGGSKNIGIPKKNDFNDLFENDGIYYVDIGNNYSRFKACGSNTIYNYCEELGLSQDACVIMGVRTNNIDTLRKILAFRKEILREAEKDFNNGIVNELSMSRQVARDLTSSEITTHSNSPHMPYGRLFRRLGDDLEAQCDILSAYMSLIISEYYRDLVKRSLDQDGVESPKKNKNDADDKRIRINVKDIMPTMNFSGIVGTGAAPYIAFAVKMIKYKINQSKAAENRYVSKISVMFNDKDLLNEDEESIKRLFDGFYLYDQFRSSPDDIVTVFMIVDTLIRNAESHCCMGKRGDMNVTVSFDINNNKSIDLVVKNPYNENDDPRTGKGITLYALANLFGTKNSQSGKDACLWHSRLNLAAGESFTGQEFEVRISNYLFKL